MTILWRFPLTCPHPRVCDDEQECERRSCGLCLDPSEPCLEHRTRARESAAHDAAERSRS